jgi:bifunctional DNA-binding transcriptional regulator/antitoxin component of YhaV-PrlF toxin-antitoxin module
VMGHVTINNKNMENKKEVRKLTKNGKGSMYVILPKEHLKSLGWRERQRLEVERVKGGIFIKDFRK